MARKATFVVLVVVAILLLQFADCMSAMTQDPQSMKCCGSMPCDPSNQTHDCCKVMVSLQSPSVLPAAHVTLPEPTMVAADVLAVSQILTLYDVSRSNFAAPQHSPPELYTVNSSFLI